MQQGTESGVPEWFLVSLNKIDLLYPRAYVAEYVRVSFVTAYYKTHFRTEFEKIAEEYNGAVTHMNFFGTSHIV